MIQGQLSDVQAATTDSSGRFTVRNLAPGSHRVFATRDGFVRSEYGQRGTRPGTPIDLLAGETKRNVNLSLTPMGVISGRVVDADGQPMPGAFVRVSRGTYNQGELSLNSVQRLQTNDLGEFRFFNLEPGPYYVQALPAYAPAIEGDTYVIPPTTSPDSIGGEPSVRLSLAEALAQGVVSAAAFQDETYLTVYYPGTTDQAGALPIDLKPGAVFSGLEFRTVKTRTLRVRGRVISSVTGQPDPSFTVGLSLPYGTDQRGGSSQNADGTFDFRVPPGKYVLSGQKARMSTQEQDMYARMTVEVGDKDIDGITLSLNPSFSLSGRVTIEGRPVGVADPAYARVLFTLTGLGGRPADSTGSFNYPTVRPGEIRFLLLRPPPGMYYKAARLGTREVLDSGFELTSQPADLLEVILSPNAATITVTVVDENQKPVQGATAAIIASDPARRKRQDLNKSAASNASGQVVFDGLAPGEYKVFAWEEIAPGAWQNPETLRTYDSRGQSVRLIENSRENIMLRVIR